MGVKATSLDEGLRLAESARAEELRTQFPDGDRVPAIVVVPRRDGGPLSPADQSALTARPVLVSTDGRAAVATFYAPGPWSARVSLDEGAAHHAAVDVVDLLSGERYYWRGEWNYVRLDPGGAFTNAYARRSVKSSPVPCHTVR